MAIVQSGIKNVGDFYSPHYMDALLESDLKGLYSAWAEAEKEKHRTPPRALAALERPFFDTKARVRRTVLAEHRYQEARELHRALLEALGYEPSPCTMEIASTVSKKPASVPLLCRLQRDGAPYLWVLEVPFPDLRPVLAPAEAGDATGSPAGDEDATDLWKQRLVEAQLPADPDGEDSTPDLAREPLEDLPARLFALDEPPRWLLMMAGQHLVLADRTRWAQGKYLLFDLDELLGSKDNATLKAAAALLSRDGLCPDGASVLHDTLGENSHKHAYAVSEDLKYGVRRAVELLANEYVWYQRNKAKQKLFFDQEERELATAEGERLGRDLTRECLRYLYRLLFLFYAEARGGELGVVPMESEEYRLGYSLESLRDLEQVPLTDPVALDGLFLHYSLQRLFAIVNRGHGDPQLDIDYSRKGKAIDRGFSVEGLHSPLFDKAATPMLSSIKPRNRVLQEIIELLSLSREKKAKGRGKKKGRGGKAQARGRISYAQLGINQLGAVYEGLLSYTGFFAREPLYEVAPAGADPDDGKTQTYFVPESELGRYKPEEIVTDEDPDTCEVRRRRFEKGAFIFRLAGRDRQKSASYYTPEVLTKCLVKYSLKELLKGKSADEILHLTVCEPAMGSGAFLNEAINQLAEAYLKRKQAEVGQKIPPAQFQEELQKVKAHMATHNCYGVDLNPTAVELARVSLWLNTIFQGSHAPWFRPRMAVGNSLVGCRRAVYSKSQVMAGKWWTHEPKAVPLADERPEGTIYHFLLPDGGMAPFDKDKVVKGLCPDEVAEIKAWRKEATKKVSRADADLLSRLSDSVDLLWAAHTKERRLLLDRTRQPIPVWGQPEQSKKQVLSIAEREKLAAHLDRPYTAHARLRLVMDYWCAQWFWPISQAETLPTRDELLMDLQMVLEGTVTATSTPARGEQPELLALLEEDQEVVEALYEDVGYVDTDELCRTLPRLGLVREVRERLPFHHWELAFAEVFGERGGFDLIVGNPPWVNIEWKEIGLVGDYYPWIQLRKSSSEEISQARGHVLSSAGSRASYIEELEEQVGAASILSSTQIYADLKRSRPNLYKSFIVVSWCLGSGGGVAGLIHQNTIFEEKNANTLRRAVYPRLRLHARFRNERLLFSEVDHKIEYSLNVYSCHRERRIDFQLIANLFHPSTIDGSIAGDQCCAIPGIKTDGGQWEIKGHPGRLIRVTLDELSLFYSIYGPRGGTIETALLPSIHSTDEYGVYRKLSECGSSNADLLESSYYISEHFNERRRQDDGTIVKTDEDCEDVNSLVITGSYLAPGNPYNKQPRLGCRHNLDFDVIDLTSVAEGFVPRTRYIPGDRALFEANTPQSPWGKVTDYCRIAFRGQLKLGNERSFITAIIPPGVAHVHSVQSLLVPNYRDMCLVSGYLTTILGDFYFRSGAKTSVYYKDLKGMPFGEVDCVGGMIVNRVLLLNCITSHYAGLWGACWDNEEGDSFVKDDERLPPFPLNHKSWSENCPLRTWYSRRQALIELDVLYAISFSYTEEELVSIYRTYFPVLRNYDGNTWFDSQGQIAFTPNGNGLPGVGVKRNSFETWVKQLQTSTSLPPDFDKKGLVPPFDKCDREADMRQAYREFQRRLADQDQA